MKLPEREVDSIQAILEYALQDIKAMRNSKDADYNGTEMREANGIARAVECLRDLAYHQEL